MENTLRLLRISKHTREYADVKRLYLTAFPPAERLPFRLLTKRAAAGKADFWGLYDGSRWVGFAYVIRGEGLAYLYFFAVSPENRNGGYGSAALQTMKQLYENDNLFLALEQPDPHADNYNERLRRHDFYLRNGLHDLPHKIREMTMVYNAMGTGTPIAPAAFDRMMRRFLGKLFYFPVHTKIIPDETD